MRYDSGWRRIPNTVWLVETIKNNKFVRVGIVFVEGQEVSREMDNHKSIKGYMPYDLALKKALSKANPPIIHEILLSKLEWRLCEVLRCGSRSLKELTKMNPKFSGALGNLKSRGLVHIVKLPNRERRIFCNE